MAMLLHVSRAEETGIFIPGEVRDIRVLHIPLLIGRNNSSAMILQKAPDWKTISGIQWKWMRPSELQA